MRFSISSLSAAFTSASFSADLASFLLELARVLDGLRHFADLDLVGQFLLEHRAHHGEVVRCPLHIGGDLFALLKRRSSDVVPRGMVWVCPAIEAPFAA
jgi:hypothetical protein